MPWELNIVRYHEDEQCSLGDRQSVIDHVAKVFPGWTLSPPPLPPQEAIDQMSPETRTLFLRPMLRMLYEEDDLSFEFWYFLPFRGRPGAGESATRVEATVPAAGVDRVRSGGVPTALARLLGSRTPAASECGSPCGLPGSVGELQPIA